MQIKNYAVTYEQMADYPQYLHKNNIFYTLSFLVISCSYRSPLSPAYRDLHMFSSGIMFTIINKYVIWEFLYNTHYFGHFWLKIKEILLLLSTPWLFALEFVALHSIWNDSTFLNMRQVMLTHPTNFFINLFL